MTPKGSTEGPAQRDAPGSSTSFSLSLSSWGSLLDPQGWLGRGARACRVDPSIPGRKIPEGNSRRADRDFRRLLHDVERVHDDVGGERDRVHRPGDLDDQGVAAGAQAA